MSDIEIHIYKAFVSGIVSLLVVFIAAKLGLSSFFKQKEFELVRDRYLFDGVDKIRAYNINTMVSYKWNFIQVNKCLSQAYHGEKAFSPDNCLSSLRDIDDINACGLEYTRVTRLLNDESLWKLNDSIIGDVISENDHLTRIVEILKYAEEDKLGPNALLRLKDEIEKSHAQLNNKVTIITAFLTEITDILEETKMEFSSVKRFSDDITVSQLTGNIRKYFESENKKI